MIQLTYHIAFDPFHSTFRQLLLRELIGKEVEIPQEHVRIVDFFVVFPQRLVKMRLAKNHSKFRNLLNRLKNQKSYSELPDDQIMFERMRPFQEAAMLTLAIKNYIKSEKLDVGLFCSTPLEIGDEVRERLEAAAKKNSELTDFFKALLFEYPFLGADGLKARTGLGEFRYDAV